MSRTPTADSELSWSDDWLEFVRLGESPSEWLKEEGLEEVDFWLTKMIPRAKPAQKMAKAIKSSDRTNDFFILIFNNLKRLE